MRITQKLGDAKASSGSPPNNRELETKTQIMTGNLILSDSLLTDKQDPAIECSHEFDMNDENDQVSVIDAVSVQTELEQLFNEFNDYNHHLSVFKKLLNLKELKNQYNFFAFNRQNEPGKPCCNATHNGTHNGTHPTSSSPSHSSPSANPFNSLIISSTATKLFKGGELSAMQVHSQLEHIKQQFIESQMLVTCLVHNLQRLRKHYCGTALDLVSSSELLASLEKDHSTLKTCKSIFKYQCSEKRKQLNKLKQQLRQAHEDWNQLIVKRPTITKLSDEELRLLNKSKEREKKKRKSIQLASNLDPTNQLGGQSRQIANGAVTGEMSSEVNRKVNCDVDGVPNAAETNSNNNPITDGNSSTSSDSNDPVVEKEKDTGSSSRGSDSAVHSESEADSLQELAEAIYRRKSKLDRLERECYSFMSRLANRNRTTDEVQASADDEQANEQYDNSNLILDDYNDYANDYEEEDDDLLDDDDDEEYEDVEFDDEDPQFDAFASGEIDIESLINRYTMDANLQADDESTSRDDEPGDPVREAAGTINDEMELANGDERLINDEIRRSVDYLIGQSRSIVNSTDDLDDEQMNRFLNVNPNETSPTIDRLVELEVMNGVRQQDSSTADQPAEARPSSAQRSRLSLGGESPELLPVESDDLDLPLVPRAAQSTEESAQLAETGEPIALCRLRRRAVKVLAARIRTEKEYYEKREDELRKKLDHLVARNEELESRLAVQQPHSNALFLFSTAFVFCSLISYFMQTLN